MRRLVACALLGAFAWWLALIVKNMIAIRRAEKIMKDSLGARRVPPPGGWHIVPDA